MLSIVWLPILFVFIVGLCFGSFYNVVILRGLSGESIVFPGSKCPKCGNPLKWYHNIPLLSYVFLRGKCAYCRTRISIQYPIVEFITAILFIISYLRWGFSLQVLFMLSILSLFLITIVTDLKERVIITSHSYILCGLGLLLSLVATFYPQILDFNINKIYMFCPILSSVSGLIAGAAVMEIMARLGYLVAGKRAFGEGDSYIAAALGAILGIKYILIVLILAGIIQFLVSLPLFLFNTYRQGKKFVAVELVLFLTLAVLLFLYSIKLDKIVYFSGLILLVLMAMHLIRNIISGMKTSNNNTYLPFVPAMNIAAIIIMFIIF